MSDSWKTVKAEEVQIGDVVRTQGGDVVTVSHIEAAFLGRKGMLAFIEDTPQRWYKRPVPADADVEVQTA